MPTARSATLCLLNEQRAAAGLAPLASQQQIEGAATRHSQAMVDGRFFDHVSPAGEDLQQRLAGYLFTASGWAIGENIAWGEGSKSTPAYIVDAWMHSSAHRTNILSPGFREIGIGIVNGSPKGSAPPSSATYTTDFGARDGVNAPSPGPPPSAGATTTASGIEVSAASAGNAAPRPKRISAARKRRITAQCARIARRKHGSPKKRAAAVEQCVKTKVRAAGLRA